MQSFGSAERLHNLETLACEDFDVLVIGGGVTGAGVALDAVTRGYKVALVEKGDFASGTSSKATKLVHGGIRYLPNFDFSLVHEALTERGLLLQNAPYLVQPLAFVLPIYEGERHPVGIPFTTPGGIGLSKILDLGLWLYDVMAGKRNVGRHRRLKRVEVLELAPPIVARGLKEGFVYYDAQTNDARLTMALIRTAASYGATIANYAEVIAFVLEDGKVRGARVRDVLGQRELTVRARHVVSATGIFTERVEELAGEHPQVQVEPSKGVHLVFSREDLKIGESAIVLPETDDKRILFIVPWQSRVLLGTTDTGSGDLDHPVALPDDINYLLGHLNRYLATRLTREDIVSVYAGYRPLVKARTSRHSNAQLSRSHTVLQSETGLISIVGGKLTTYRRMAQDTVDVLSKRDKAKLVHATEDLPLQGSVGWAGAQQKLVLEGAKHGLAPDTIRQLGWSHGTEAHEIVKLVAEDAALGQRIVADLPYIWAEVVYACRHEMALAPDDVLARRMAIALEDRRRGLGVVDEVAALMAKELGWTPEQQKMLAERYREAVERQVAAEEGMLLEQST